MADTLNVIIGVIGTAIGLIVPLLFQRRQRTGNEELAAKRFWRRVLLGVAGLTLIAIATLAFILGSVYHQPTNTANTRPPAPGKYLDVAVASLAWSPDGTQIATTDWYEGSIQIWDVSSEKPLITYQPPTINTSSLVWSPDGKYLAANVDGVLSLFQIEEKKLTLTGYLPDYPLADGSQVIAWSPSGTQIAMASGHTLYVWKVTAGHLETSQKPLVYSRHTQAIFALCWLRDEQSIVSASLDDTLHLWKLSQGNTPSRIISADTLVTGRDQSGYSANIACSPDGRDIAIANDKGILSIWSLKGKKLFSLVLGQKNSLYLSLTASSIAWSPDSQYIATGMYNDDLSKKKVAVIDASGEQIRSFSYIDIYLPMSALAWSPDQKSIAMDAQIDTVAILPSNQDDGNYVYTPQAQNESSWLPLLEDESIFIGFSLGNIALYSAFAKTKLYYRSKSRKQKLLNMLINILLHLFPVCITILLMIVFSSRITYDDLNICTIMGCCYSAIFIFPSFAKTYIYPQWLLLLRLRKTRLFVREGETYRKQEKYALAITQYDRALALLPKNASAYRSRGQAYFLSGEYQQALEDLNRASYLQPQKMTFDDYYFKGLIYSSLKKYQTALEAFNIAIDLTNEDQEKGSLYYQRAMTHLQLNHLSEARLDFLRSANLKPTLNRELMVLWTGLTRKRPDKETAAQLAIDFKAIASHNNLTTPFSLSLTHICSGLSLALQGNVKNALKELDQAIALFPQNTIAHFWRGMLLAYYYQGRSHCDEVLKALQQALTHELPPVLLFPLHWLEKDVPAFFVEHIQPLLELHEPEQSTS